MASLARAGIPAYRTPAGAVRGFVHLADYHKAQRALTRTPPSLPEDDPVDRDAVRAMLAPALAEGRRVLNEPEATAVLAAYGIPTAETRIAATPEEAGTIADELLAKNDRAGAVVVKIFSPDITHKSDVGGVRLNLASGEEARAAAGAMIEQARAHVPDARIEGFAVQPMIHRPGAHELILGIADDRVFGSVVLFGARGTSVEVVADKALALPPLDLVLADDLIRATRVGRLLEGSPRRRPGRHRVGAGPLGAARGGFPRDPRTRRQPAARRSRRRRGTRRARRRRGDGTRGTGRQPQVRAPPLPLAVGADRQGQEDRPCASGRYGRRTRPSTTCSSTVSRRATRTIASLASSPTRRTRRSRASRGSIAPALDADSGELMGVARLAADADYARAVIVRSDVQGRGIGRTLMQQLIDYAHAEPIGSLYGDMLGDNRAMLELCRGLGFSQSAHPEASDVQRLCLATE